MKPKQKCVYSQLQKPRHSPQNTIAPWFRTGETPEAQYRHVPIARHQLSLFKPLRKTCRSCSSLACRSVTAEMLGSGHVYCPKVGINQLEIKHSSLQNFGEFHNCQCKMPINKWGFDRFFFPFFLSLFLSFLQPFT